MCFLQCTALFRQKLIILNSKTPILVHSNDTLCLYFWLYFMFPYFIYSLLLLNLIMLQKSIRRYILYYYNKIEKCWLYYLFRIMVQYKIFSMKTNHINVIYEQIFASSIFARDRLFLVTVRVSCQIIILYRRADIYFNVYSRYDTAHHVLWLHWCLS